MVCHVGYQRLQKRARQLSVFVYTQVGADERSNQPTPDCALVVNAIALLGVATSGVWLACRGELIKRANEVVPGLAATAGVTTAAVLWLVVHTRVDAFSLLADRNEGGLLFQILVLIVPFFFDQNLNIA